MSLTRKCNQCGTTYDVRRQGKGGGVVRSGETPETFPYDARTFTGVRPENAHWFHGAQCSVECYAAAYYEPPGL